MDKHNKTEHFSKWRAILWPIYNYEIKKFLPMALIMFCFLFNYTVMRDTKDVLVVNAAGAHITSFLKLYFVTPAAILFVILYAKLCNALSKENVFYAVIVPFLVFFGLFGFVIYPNIDILHPAAETVARLHTEYPNLGGFIDIYANWSFSLFYVMAEIWGSAMISLLFWQFANQVTRMNEAKRFYPLFPLVANLSLIFAGQSEHFANNIQHYVDVSGNHYALSLKILMTLVVLMGALAMYLYRWMHVKVLSDPFYYDEAEVSGKTKSKKPKLSLVESAKLIFSSPELGLIVLLVVSYGISINLVELQWKHQLKLYYAGDMSGYHAFMGNFSTFTGIFTMIFILGVGANLLRSVSWFKAAVITPLMILLCGAAFFIFILGRDGLEVMLSDAKLSAVAFAAFLGAGLIVFSKAVKYSLFDPTKEMAYIPLDDELKTKGKAAVDVLGGRLGKAGGAFIQSTLAVVMATKDVAVMAPITFGIFVIICIIWLFAVQGLGKKIHLAMKRKEEQAKVKAANA
ncbi:Npt1/Npt2 family nucleotide transporter [Rickettsiales endosymbiont of Stachyamoeba lipophora]|uniref:Npt1/Npt2 family nucleotide transporter n=1 Tax=Rickettsiales endosymbiont of Stachyamoeba lipophora TaxID=2486578 RepID=UPI000F64B108|nr:Npt1/Npt2 family nucleotide transporter [Rickettsiales endosymbiont of Stachyamoeba lipophora]AZL15198.1 NTP/NDP exchange transporter [Rickettsiales endosymbiont of Stachyamoeba lipophora]